MIQLIVTFFQHYFTAPLIIFILSLFPLLELRGGLIAASLLGVPWQQAAVLTVIANMIPIPFIILLVERVLDHCALKGPFQFLAKKNDQKRTCSRHCPLKKISTFRTPWTLFVRCYPSSRNRGLDWRNDCCFFGSSS